MQMHLTLPFVLFCTFSFLHGRLRTCTLRSDHEGQSTLMNLLLRNYLAYNLYDQADKLVSKTTFPESASNNEWARYLFYLGKFCILTLLLSRAHNVRCPRSVTRMASPELPAFYKLDPGATHQPFSHSLVGKSRSLFSLSLLSGEKGA